MLKGKYNTTHQANNPKQRVHPKDAQLKRDVSLAYTSTNPNNEVVSKGCTTSRGLSQMNQNTT